MTWQTFGAILDSSAFQSTTGFLTTTLPIRESRVRPKRDRRNLGKTPNLQREERAERQWAGSEPMLLKLAPC